MKLTEVKGENKRFLCFGLPMYEAYGGTQDIRESFETKEEAITWLETNPTYEVKLVYDRIEDIEYFYL